MCLCVCIPSSRNTCVCKFRFGGRGSMGLMLVMIGQIPCGLDVELALDVVPRVVTHIGVGRKILYKEEIALIALLAPCLVPKKDEKSLFVFA